jgi:hypothetical protein
MTIAPFQQFLGIRGGAAPQNSDYIVCGAVKARIAGKAAGPERGPCATPWTQPMGLYCPETPRGVYCVGLLGAKTEISRRITPPNIRENVTSGFAPSCQR